MSEGVLIPWVVAATILLVVAVYWIYLLEKRIKTLDLRYRTLAALAEEGDRGSLIQVLSRLQQHESQIGGLQTQLEKVSALLPHVVQGLGVVRYSAFENVGGDQSFSLALVDANGNGVVVSGLQGREDSRVYAKPLVQWRSSYSLSPDEQRALADARRLATSDAPSGG